MSLGLVSRNGGRVGGSLKLHVPFWGDFCWEIQMLKNRVTTER